MHGIDECCHGHKHQYSDDEISTKQCNLLLAVGGNGILSLIEWYAFLWTGSMPVNATCLHDLADFGASLILLVLVKGAQKAPYLWSVAGLLSGIFMIGATGIAFIQGIEHMRHPQVIKTDGLIWLAVLNFCANAVMALRLKDGKSDAEKISLLHFLQDVAGAGAILLTWIISSLTQFAESALLDAFIAVLIAGIILMMAIWQTGRIIFGKAIKNMINPEPKDR